MSYNYYKRKRIKKGLAKSDIARELGIDYKRYNAIEKGEIKMPTKLINKFNEIINKEDIFPEIGAINENEHTTNDTKYDELIKKYQEELDTLNEICEMYKTRLQEITLRTQTCKEIINVINELRNEG